MSKLSFDDNHNLIYENIDYYPVDDYFEVRTSTEDTVVELGWQSQFPFFPDIYYYAFDEENPLFIFCDNGQSSLYNKGLYVRSDYDIYSKLFVIKDTDIEFILSSAITKSDVDIASINDETTIFYQMYLKDDPRVQIEMSGPYRFNDSWYFIYSGEAYILSEELAGILQGQGK